MKKNGQATLWFMIELIGAILIVSIAIEIATTLSQGTFFEKLNIARDISMQINTLSGLPGDGYIVNKNLHGYSLHFLNNKVEVYEDVNEISKGTHSFVTIGSSNFDSVGLVFEKPNQVVVSKIGNEIKISRDIPIIEPTKILKPTKIIEPTKTGEKEKESTKEEVKPPPPPPEEDSIISPPSIPY